MKTYLEEWKNEGKLNSQIQGLLGIGLYIMSVFFQCNTQKS